MDLKTMMMMMTAIQTKMKLLYLLSFYIINRLYHIHPVAQSGTFLPPAIPVLSAVQHYTQVSDLLLNTLDMIPMGDFTAASIRCCHIL